MKLPSLKNKVTWLLLFYTIAIGWVVYVEASGNFKSGPCTPNLDFVAPLLLLVVTVILTIISLVAAVFKKGNRYMVAINLRWF